MTDKDALLLECHRLLKRAKHDYVNSDEIESVIARLDAALSQPDAAPGDAVCPHIVISREGTTYCRLAESGPQPAEAREVAERVREAAAKVSEGMKIRNHFASNNFPQAESGFNEGVHEAAKAIRALDLAAIVRGKG